MNFVKLFDAFFVKSTLAYPQNHFSCRKVSSAPSDPPEKPLPDIEPKRAKESSLAPDFLALFANWENWDG